MNRAKVYNNVVDAKNLIQDLAYECGAEALFEFPYRDLARNGFVFACACKSVIESGVFLYNDRWGYTFNMPPTSLCIRNYEAARKDWKKLRPYIVDNNF